MLQPTTILSERNSEINRENPENSLFSQPQIPNNRMELKVSESNGIQTVSARELHEKLEIKTRYDTWFNRVCEYGFTENIDFVLVVQKRATNNPKNPETTYTEHFISLDMAKQICMLQRTEIGKKYRQYLIELEKAWNSPEAVMARALQFAEQKLEEARHIVAIQQPKVEVYDRIVDSTGLKSVEEVAKTLNFGKNNFFALMRGMGVFYYCNSDGDRINLPKQEYIDRGYFQTKEEPYERNGKSKIYTKIYVTGKGEVWLTKKINESVESAAENWAEKEGEE